MKKMTSANVEMAGPALTALARYVTFHAEVYDHFVSPPIHVVVSQDTEAKIAPKLFAFRLANIRVSALILTRVLAKRGGSTPGRFYIFSYSDAFKY